MRERLKLTGPGLKHPKQEVMLIANATTMSTNTASLNVNMWDILI